MRPPAAVPVHLVAVHLAAAKRFVTLHHRRHRPPVSGLFAVGAARDDGTLVAVGIAGRPVARAYDDGATVEVRRVASDGTTNTCSMVYAALARAALSLGYRRVVTYTQDGEPGSSLRGAGWRTVAERPARACWDTMSRPRENIRYDTIPRTLWEATTP
jgi:hypothetical protein